MLNGLISKLSGWARLWLIFTLIWGGWFLYQGATSADQYQKARRYQERAFNDLCERDNKISEAKDELNKTRDLWLKRIQSHGIHRQNKDLDNKIRELNGEIGFQKSQMELLSKMHSDSINWASDSREKYEQAYTLGPLVPILLIVLFGIVRWISKGFKDNAVQSTTPVITFEDPVADNLISTEPKFQSESTPQNQSKIVENSNQPRPVVVPPSTHPNPINASVWPKWEWSDWVGILLVGYVGHLIAVIFAAFVIGKNSSVMDAPNAMAFHVVPFLLYYGIKRLVVKSKGLEPTLQRKFIFLGCYMLFVLFFNILQAVKP